MTGKDQISAPSLSTVEELQQTKSQHIPHLKFEELSSTRNSAHLPPSRSLMLLCCGESQWIMVGNQSTASLASHTSSQGSQDPLNIHYCSIRPQHLFIHISPTQHFRANMIRTKTSLYFTRRMKVLFGEHCPLSKGQIGDFFPFFSQNRPTHSLRFPCLPMTCVSPPQAKAPTNILQRSRWS